MEKTGSVRTIRKLEKFGMADTESAAGGRILDLRGRKKRSIKKRSYNSKEFSTKICGRRKNGRGEDRSSGL